LRIYLDYSVTGMECFDNNTQILADQTKAALEDLREAGYAVARADVVAHGVGGVLARMWATGEGPVYHTQETFKQGAVHRLIAIGSPFQGSPLGNFAANFGRGLSGSAMDAVYNAVSGSFAAPADNTRPGEISSRIRQGDDQPQHRRWRAWRRGGPLHAPG
jgi:triacylglycerol esterase/lipase EstA (alpha/beta hydrolase family)